MGPVVVDPLVQQVVHGKPSDPLVDPCPVDVPGLEAHHQLDASRPLGAELGQHVLEVLVAGRLGLPRRVDAARPRWLVVTITATSILLPALGLSVVVLLVGEQLVARLRKQ